MKQLSQLYWLWKKYWSTLKNVEGNLCPVVSNIQLRLNPLCKNRQAYYANLLLSLKCVKIPCVSKNCFKTIFIISKTDYFSYTHLFIYIFCLLFSTLNIFNPVFEMFSSLSSKEMGKDTTQYWFSRQLTALGFHIGPAGGPPSPWESLFALLFSIPC